MANLGMAEVVMVIIYRVMIRLRIHPVCYIKSDIPAEPFFDKSRLPKLNLPPVSSWENCARLFSHIDVPLGEGAPDWLTNPISGRGAKIELQPFWKISEFDEEVGDVKLVWEQSRMDWVLAFAQRARNGDATSLERLNSWLTHWLSSNPPYLGVNWKCGQEASIRVMHICCAALILGQERQSLPGLIQIVRLHLRRIAPTIHYAIAQNNNHGTSEAAALFIGGSWLSAKGCADGKRWEKKGRRWLENRAQKLIGKDGSFSQYSLNYHRMLLDTFSIVEIWRQRMGGAPFSFGFYDQAKSATSWLYQMVAPNTGDGPNLGANDGARLLQLTDSAYRDYRPSIQLGMAVFLGRCAYAQSGSWELQLAWLGVPKADHAAPTYSDCDYDDGGYKILRCGEASLMFRYPRFNHRPSQADALHVDLWVGGVNLLRDAGSYSYNSEPDLSWYFSGTVAHNTVQFDNRDQMPKLSRFLFGSWLRTKHLNPISRNNGSVACSAGYSDFKQAEHVRTVQLKEGCLCVVDNVTGFDERAVLRWRLPDGCWEIQTLSKGVVVSNGASFLKVNASVPIVNSCLVEGWVSMFYLDKDPTVVLEVEIDVAGTFNTEYRW